MPYIPKSEQKLADKNIYNNAGSLNYSIHQMISKYLDGREKRYSTYNEIIGVLDCVKMELYRRLVADYEEEKLAEYGDVKPYKLEDWIINII